MTNRSEAPSSATPTVQIEAIPSFRKPLPTRRSLLAAALMAVGGSALPASWTAGRPAGVSSTAARSAESSGGALPPYFPHQDPELVQRVVGASHSSLDTVRELVGRWPELAKAQWDWGLGDWESALGAASHTGRREIAEFLIAHGARPTLFSAAMLGQLTVVRAYVEAAPGVQEIPGPHGIPLLVHARAGGDAAAPVVAYLEEVGGAGGDAWPALEEGVAARLVGTYRTAAGEVLEVTEGRRGLMLGEPEGVARGMIHRGDGVFHLAGALSARVGFEGLDGEGPVRRLTLAAGGWSVGAARVASRD